MCSSCDEETHPVCRECMRPKEFTFQTPYGLLYFCKSHALQYGATLMLELGLKEQGPREYCAIPACPHGEVKVHLGYGDFTFPYCGHHAEVWGEVVMDRMGLKPPPPKAGPFIVETTCCHFDTPDRDMFGTLPDATTYMFTVDKMSDHHYNLVLKVIDSAGAELVIFEVFAQ